MFWSRLRICHIGVEKFTQGELWILSAVTETAVSRAKGYVPQVAILITGRESSDEVELPARKLRNRGIARYVVGTGVQNTAELQQIASKPFGKYLYRAGSFDDLQDLSTRPLGNLCFAVQSERESKKLFIMCNCENKV